MPADTVWDWNNLVSLGQDYWVPQEACCANFRPVGWVQGGDTTLGADAWQGRLNGSPSYGAQLAYLNVTVDTAAGWQFMEPHPRREGAYTRVDVFPIYIHNTGADTVGLWMPQGRQLPLQLEYEFLDGAWRTARTHGAGTYPGEWLALPPGAGIIALMWPFRGSYTVHMRATLSVPGHAPEPVHLADSPQQYYTVSSRPFLAYIVH